MSDISERIKRIRKDAGLNQTDFGKRIGLTQGTISGIESKDGEITDRTILSVCKEFNIAEHWLRTGAPPMRPEPTEADELAQLLQGASPTKALLLRIIASLPDYLLVDLRREIRQIMRKLPPQPTDEE